LLVQHNLQLAEPLAALSRSHQPQLAAVLALQKRQERRALAGPDARFTEQKQAVEVVGGQGLQKLGLHRLAEKQGAGGGQAGPQLLDDSGSNVRRGMRAGRRGRGWLRRRRGPDGHNPASDVDGWTRGGTADIRTPSSTGDKRRGRGGKQGFTRQRVGTDRSAGTAGEPEPLSPPISLIRLSVRAQWACGSSRFDDLPINLP
jgi:hypothetical protein